MVGLLLLWTNVYVIIILYFNSLENDRPTIKHLSLFVLSQSDVVRSWERLGSELLNRSISLRHNFLVYMYR